MSRKSRRRSRHKEKVAAQQRKHHPDTKQTTAETSSEMPAEAELHDLKGATANRDGAPAATQDTQRVEDQSELTRWTRVVALWTGGLVGVGILTVVILGVQAIIFWRTDETARETQRAAVFVKDIESRFGRTLDGKSQQYTFFVDWTNGGTTSTRDFEYRQAGASRVEFGKDLRWKKWFADTKSPWYKTYIGPNATQRLWCCGGLVSYYLTNLLDPSTRGLYLVGEARYFDIYGKRHYTSFCYEGRLSPEPNEIMIQSCFQAEARFNCADTKECEDQQ